MDNHTEMADELSTPVMEPDPTPSYSHKQFDESYSWIIQVIIGLVWVLYLMPTISKVISSEKPSKLWNRLRSRFITKGRTESLTVTGNN